MKIVYARAALLLLIALALVVGPGGCVRNGAHTGDSRSRASSAHSPRPRHELALLVSHGDEAGTLWLWDTEGKGLRQLAPDYEVHGFCFSPGGTRIAFSGQRVPAKGEFHGLELWVLNLASGAVEQVTSGLWAGQHREIAWRPATEQVAVTRAERRDPEASLPDDGGLWLVDVVTGGMTCLIEPANADWPMCQQPRFSSDGAMLATKRQGRYAAVLQVDRPAYWLRLDSPKYLNPDFLMDWVWRPGTHTLLLAATMARRAVRVRGSDGTEVVGPGGIWEWRLSEQRALIAPQLLDWACSDQHQTVAEPLLGQGTTVFALGLSRDGSQVAYVTPDGIWVRDLERGTDRHVLALDLSDLSEFDADWGAGPTLALLSWSPDDWYLWANPGDDASCVVEVVSGHAMAVPKAADQAAWRPDA